MRAVWTGNIILGLVTVPVKLYPATKERRVSFEILRKGDLCPVGYLRVCKITGEEVTKEEVVKGFEYKRGNYIVLDSHDFEKANARKTGAMEIFHFTDEAQIDKKYFEKPFYLEPDKNADPMYTPLPPVCRHEI